jgi:heme/copper-type cytochrome/quinol oxidase subunit 4
MAKRRKEKDEDEDKPFKLPKFDEEKFLKRERRNIKSTFISFLFGILIAIVCFGFWALMAGETTLRWPLVVLVALANAAFIKYIYIRINLDISDFTKKNWFSSYIIYLFTWLIVFIVLVNPPFYDDESPRIELAVLPEMQEPGGDVILVAKITDNTGIELSDITLTVDDNTVPSSDYTFDTIDNIFIYIYESPDNFTVDETHSFRLSVKDDSGHTTGEEGSFTFSNNTIYLALPDEGEVVKAASDVKFGVQTKAWRVYYTVNGGREINASQQSDREDYYVTSPEYQGWPAGDNATLQVSAVVLYNFPNHFYRDDAGVIIVDGEGSPIPVWFVNHINDTNNYTFEVADESTVGLTASDEISYPKARYVLAPGFEILVFIIALIIVGLIYKRKKKNRRNQK